LTPGPYQPRRIARSEKPLSEVQAARGDVEAALDGARWPWNRQLSLGIDCLVILEGQKTQ
jgi:hypothetical protein